MVPYHPDHTSGPIYAHTVPVLIPSRYDLASLFYFFDSHLASWETLASMPRTKSKNHRPAAVSNDPTTKAAATTSPDESRSVSQLLRLLEARLDKHIDDIRYVSSITAKLDIPRAN